MTNHRLTVTAAIAVVAASFSLYTLIKGNGWMAAAIGAVAMVALAGSLARLATIPAAVAATAAVLVAIVPPLAGQGWPGRIGALILLALVALSATGARPLRAFAALATYASFLLFYLNIAFAGGPSYGGVVPSASSVAALSRLPGQASPQFKYSPPILPTRPVEFFAAAGIGIVAILVDIIAVRMRRPALAGLPLLLLYSVPVATSLKGFGLYQSLTFAIAIAAYLALLSADGKQRLRMWGRLVTVRRMSRGDEAGSGPDTRALTASGRRVGLAAVCLALVVPVVLVGTTPHDLFKKNPDGSGTLGSSQSGELSPLLTVGQQLAEGNSPVLWYRTDAAEPNQQYLQAYVLNYYPSLNDWLPYNTHIARIRAHRLPLAVPGLAGGTPATVVHTSIVMRELREAPLPLPYAPVQVSDPGASLQEGTGTLMVFDPQTQTNVHFSVTSREAVPDKSLLSLPGNYPTSIHNAYGSYTGPDVRQLTQIAEAHIAKAQTPLQIAVDLQDWLSSFTYTTKPNIPAGRGWLLDFLTKDKRGDCEQFAPAMAVLARLVGIPARVAVGYTAGTPVGNGQWQVTTADAHAWPELYFPQVGWVRFEPTPGGVGQQATAIAPPYSVGKLPPVAPSNVGTNNGGQTKSSQHNSNGISKGKINGITGGRPGDVGKQAGSGFPIWIPIVVLVFLLLTWPALGRWLTRRRRWMAAAGDAAQAHAAWRELLDYLTDYGLTWLPSESPRAIARRIADAAKVTPEARAAVSRLATAQERASYSIAPQDGAGLHADVLAVRKALAANSTKRERMRARLLPPSTLAVAGTWVQAANQALSWIDSPLPNLRRRFRGTRHQTS